MQIVMHLFEVPQYCELVELYEFEEVRQQRGHTHTHTRIYPPCVGNGSPPSIPKLIHTDYAADRETDHRKHRSKF